MKRIDTLENLCRLTGMVRDVELRRLAVAVKSCEMTRQLLAQLGDTPGGKQPHSIDAALAAERHDLWLLQRRIALNQHLARQTAEMITARERAAQAFGRAAVMQNLADGQDARAARQQAGP